LGAWMACTGVGRGGKRLGADIVPARTGGKLVYQYVKKQSSPVVCGVSGVKLNGVSG
jgi:hypothetical protein